MKRRLLVIVMAICMAFCIVPTVAFADNGDNEDNEDYNRYLEFNLDSGFEVGGSFTNVKISSSEQNEKMDLIWSGVYGKDYAITSTQISSVDELEKATIKSGTIQKETQYYLYAKIQSSDADFDLDRMYGVFCDRIGTADDYLTVETEAGTYYLVEWELPELTGNPLKSADFKLSGYEKGNTVDDLDISTNTAGIEFTNKYSYGFAISEGKTETDFNYITDASYQFKVDTDYMIAIVFYLDDGYDYTSLNKTNVNLNGLTPMFMVTTQNYIMAYYNLNQLKDTLCEYWIPITKTVSLGGKYAPGKTTFTFELVDKNGNAIPAYKDVTYNATIETNGAGEYQGNLKICGPENQIYEYLSNGVYVREVAGTDSAWTYSDKVWYVTIANPGQDTEQRTILPVTVTKDDGGITYDVNLDDEIVDAMSFENTYTQNTAPKTGDESNIMLWMMLMIMSGAAIAGTTVVLKRRANR